MQELDHSINVFLWLSRDSVALTDTYALDETALHVLFEELPNFLRIDTVGEGESGDPDGVV